MTARIGVLGGTFDPIHYGHLAIAEEARVAMEFDYVLLVPAGQQPLKHGSHVATPEQRLAMTRLAAAGNPGLRVSPLEVERDGPSYTVTTLEQLRRTVGGELHFILGADALADLHRWRQAARLIELAWLVAIARPGFAPDLAALDARLPGASKRVTVLEGPQLDISSSALRERLAIGRPVRYLLPDAVLAYIEEHRLYR
jgi:nicotinate-nucleotide adenylyltransferase